MELPVKVVLIGEAGVGKSNILLRLLDDVFFDESMPTIGVDFRTCTRQVGDRIIKVHLWDTAGQERFRTIPTALFRGAHGIMVVYDITDRASFDRVQYWMDEISSKGMEDVVRILIGNKSDLEGSRVVSQKEGHDFAAALGIRFFETSAQSALNIDAAFRAHIQDIYDYVAISSLEMDPPERRHRLSVARVGVGVSTRRCCPR